MFNDHEYQKRRNDRNGTNENDANEAYDASLDAYASSPEDEPLLLNREERERAQRERYLDALNAQGRESDEAHYEDDAMDGKPAEPEAPRRSSRRPSPLSLADRLKDGPPIRTILLGIAALLALVLMIIGIISIVRFFKDRSNPQLTPRKTTEAFSRALAADDYEGFLKLLNQEAYDLEMATDASSSDTKAETDIKTLRDTPELRALYEDLKGAHHETAVASDYVVLRQQNGQNVLVACEWNDKTKRYEIHDVRVLDDTERKVFVY